MQFCLKITHDLPYGDKFPKKYSERFQTIINDDQNLIIIILNWFWPDHIRHHNFKGCCNSNNVFFEFTTTEKKM